MKNISIIIPVLNEQDNIQVLVERLNKTLSSHSITYEIIFIDDNSTDHTREIIQGLFQTYPTIRVHVKKGVKGKAQSLSEGFAYAIYNTICMIDGDLQYPPEAILEMMKTIECGKADIVIANRKEKRTGLSRKIISNIYNFFLINFYIISILIYSLG